MYLVSRLFEDIFKEEILINPEPGEVARRRSVFFSMFGRKERILWSVIISGIENYYSNSGLGGWEGILEYLHPWNNR